MPISKARVAWYSIPMFGAIALLDVLVVAVVGFDVAGAKLEVPPKPVPPACQRVVDTSFPADTRFPYSVKYELGVSNLKLSDRIVIKEVRGTRPKFEEGGIYRVRGEYTLGSAAEAKLALNVTAVRRGEGCTSGNRRGDQKVLRGSGTFELAAPMPYHGYPHLTFYIDGKNAGGTYFGKGQFLKKKN
jgi:hypothetical protein